MGPRGRGRGYGMGRGGHDGPFRGCGFRRTVPRQAVLEVVRDATDYLSAEQVYMEVYRRLPGIGMATVYRTLQLLTELGVVSRIATDEGKAKYRMSDDAAAPHRVVAVCRRCGKTVAVTTGGEMAERLRELQAEFEREARFEAERSVHQFYGVCGVCSAPGDTQ